MGLYQKLVAGVLFPLHERLKSHDTTAVHREMDKTQWLTPAQMSELQVRNLRDFLQRIEKTVPYYRSLFAEHSFRPADIKNITDLQRLPLMDKAVIRANTEDLKAEGAQNLQRFNTGGSSGAPLVFYLGTERVSHDVAAKRRATRWWDVDLGDSEVVVWGSPIELGAQDRVRLLRDRLFRTQLLSAFEMSETNLDNFIDRIAQIKPAMLFGYPSSLAMIATRAKERGLELDQLGIKVTFVTSERLYPHQRETIESMFGCPVANGYGGRDAGFIAHECPKGSLHLTAEDIIVEIVDEDGQVLPAGSSGEIVITHMFTSEFPFVRYRTGDVGVLDDQPCSCGRGLPVLASVEGRTTDFITAADGTVMHGLALIYVLRDIPEVGEFRIVQESLLLTRVEIIVSDINETELTATIQEQFRLRLGSEVDVQVEYLTEIPREKSGKFRYVVSKV